jgi:hypothetical protein
LNVLIRGLRERCLDLATALPDHFDDGLGIYALVDSQGDCKDIERCVLSPPGPDELGIEMRVVLVGLGFAIYIGVGVTRPTGGLFSLCCFSCWYCPRESRADFRAFAIQIIFGQ